MIVFLKAQVAGYTRQDGTVVSPYYRADRFAEHKHAGQYRKDGKTPYIAHPRAVVSILRDEAGITDRDTLIAAVLHDTIEDTGVKHAELAARFGLTVADLVAELTNDETLPKPQQKQAQIDKAPHYSDRAAWIKTADKTANLRDIIAAPPPWSQERKREYFDHARSVVHAMGPRNALLRRLFETTYLTGISQL
ncbi:bifunctional (p)ppGpp synthetase/guanosine-3',5'-bis(diphosphate) 3'-pyrophosphohydrolase [Bordetella phage vB_BbrM_PHB04]|uniref:Bifunctional (P)ppGpp synthetase/guanosine-3',5'-bis(Diphosphate) 3'-pyrophosphohydrolase n=1 Tax=Bordetella phage vB_BbrM_PHB04 TaxID=2029657 RepID=A0A291L9W9_9CAUD|nr:metal-dependent phosphohydrolase [Bordetella phage vB_BbrM_PHB04]ATI15650.1 bifunctional (p)ppGpp synthetase/guanosine-3',5'-bis(diphosphate) 3'-pyrophosphohydrolase [Bordetella phage vB_BbrM_PHB04]